MNDKERIRQLEELNAKAQTQIEEERAKAQTQIEEERAARAKAQTQIEEERAKAQTQIAEERAARAKAELITKRINFIFHASDLLPQSYESELLSLEFPIEPIPKIHRQSRVSLEAKGSTSRHEEQAAESESDHPSEPKANSHTTINASKFNNNDLPDDAKCDVVSWNLHDDQVMKMLLKIRNERNYWKFFTTKWTENLMRLQHAFQFYHDNRLPEIEVGQTQYHCLLFMKCLLIEMSSTSQLRINTTTLRINTEIFHKYWNGDYHISGKHDLIREVGNEIKQSYEIKVTNYINNHTTKTKNQVMAENMLLSDGPESMEFTRGACFDITSYSTVWLCGRTQYLEPLRTKPRSIVLRVILSLLDFSHDEMKKLIPRDTSIIIDPLQSRPKQNIQSNLSSSCPPNQNKSTRNNDTSNKKSTPNNKDNKKANGGSRKKSTNFDTSIYIDLCQIENQEQEEMELRKVYLDECEKNKILPLTIETLKKHQIPNSGSTSNILKRRPLGEITNK
jgi:chemotaxis protein histidine kinase CheA